MSQSQGLGGGYRAEFKIAVRVKATAGGENILRLQTDGSHKLSTLWAMYDDQQLGR